MGVTVYPKQLKRGYSVLWIDINFRGFRKKKSLGLKFKTNPISIREREKRQEAWRTAQLVANKQDTELLTNQYDLPEQYKVNQDFVSYAHDYIESLYVKDKRKFYIVVKRLLEFSKKKTLLCSEITEGLLKNFAKWLEQRYNGETPNNLFKKLKQITKAATCELYFRKDPAVNIQVKKRQYVQKAILDIQELRLLYETPLDNENVKNAFLFSCFTGLRFCDIKRLTWRSIRNEILSVVQEKTKAPLEIPLKSDVLKLLPERGNSDDLVFILPSQTTTLKWLKKWVESAGIDKNVTWHSARHGFGTALIASGVDVSIASKLLGHTTLQHTLRYTRIGDDLKIKAIKKLPSLQNSTNK